MKLQDVRQVPEALNFVISVVSSRCPFYSSKRRERGQDRNKGQALFAYLIDYFRR